MNVFSLLFIFLAVGMALVGIVLLIIAVVKRKWKLVALAIAGPIAGYAVMTGVAFIVIGLMDFRLKRQVANTEVIGRWTLRDESLSLARKEGYQPAADVSHRIDIRADGSCYYRSIRSFPIRVEQCEGFWDIRPAFGEPNIYELRISTKGNHNSMFSVSFTEEKGRLVLWEYLGDPDSGTYLKFDKQPNQPLVPTQ